MINNEKDNNVEEKKKELSTIHLRINKELLDQIDSFTDSYNFMNRTDAVRFLISNGLKNFIEEK